MELKTLLDNSGRPSLVAGDLNSKHTDWNSRVCTQSGHVLRSFALRSNSIRIIGPTEPTRIDPSAAGSDGVLDVLVVNNWSGHLPVPVVHCDLTLDHLSVVTELITDIRLTDLRRSTRDYDWKKFKQRLQVLHNVFTPNVDTPDLFDDFVVRLEGDIRGALLDSEKRSLHVPKILYLPKHIKDLISARNRQ